MSHPVSLVITDLDNTLWDWVSIWFSGFEPMLTALSRQSGLDRSQLEAEIQAVYRRHGTVEYAFLIEELPSLRVLHPTEDLTLVYAEAVAAFREGRRAAMRLYPGVLETLTHLKEIGCAVVGYTESMEFYSINRIKRLGLDGLLTRLYSPGDHTLPADVRRAYPPDYYRLAETEVRSTPPGELKPNPDILRSILAESGVDDVDSVIYVGDSLMKDITMAQSAGVIDVFAKYGTNAQCTAAYEVLRRVTHWDIEDVEREKLLHTSTAVTPSHVLRDSFDELLEMFNFGER